MRIITVAAITKRRANFLVKKFFDQIFGNFIRFCRVDFPAPIRFNGEKHLLRAKADEKILASPAADRVAGLGPDRFDAQKYDEECDKGRNRARRRLRPDRPDREGG